MQTIKLLKSTHKSNSPTIVNFSPKNMKVDRCL